jgi:hypothetical protein
MKKSGNNPVEFLVIAGFFLLIGSALVYRQEPMMLTGGVAGSTRGGGASGMSTSASGQTTEAVGLVGILIGLGIVGFYFKLRSDINRDEQ